MWTTDLTGYEAFEIDTRTDDMAQMGFPIKHYDAPLPCQCCSNHPSNGGNGVCNCTLGLPEIR